MGCELVVDRVSLSRVFLAVWMMIGQGSFLISAFLSLTLTHSLTLTLSHTFPVWFGARLHTHTQSVSLVPMGRQGDSSVDWRWEACISFERE